MPFGNFLRRLSFEKIAECRQSFWKEKLCVVKVGKVSVQSQTLHVHGEFPLTISYSQKGIDENYYKLQDFCSSIQSLGHHCLCVTT
jgi:hypothetical protein